MALTVPDASCIPILAGVLQIFDIVYVHRVRIYQVPDLWLLQDWMSTSLGGVYPVAIDGLPVICQVSVPPSWATFTLAWLQSGSHFGERLLYLLRSAC